MDTYKIKQAVTESQLKTDLPYIKSGDTISVTSRIFEGKKSRLQTFKGIVIKTQGSGITYSVLVRRSTRGLGVERLFKLHNPLIESVEVHSHGKVRQARIYYMRKRQGRAAKLKEVKK